MRCIGAAAGAGAAPVLRQAIQDGIAQLRQRGLERADRAVEEASQASGLPAEEAVRRLLATPAGGELLLQGLQAAAHATVEAKVKVLGKALATGALAADEPEVDRERVFVGAMAEFEAPHLRVLEHLEPRKTDGCGNRGRGVAPWSRVDRDAAARHAAAARGRVSTLNRGRG